MRVVDAVKWIHCFTLENRENRRKSWLLLGKGPSSDQLASLPPEKYHILSLNHACKLTRPTLAHFIDIEAFRDCAEYLLENNIPVVMPWYPHINMRSSRISLQEWCNTFRKDARAILLEMASNGKLLSYNSTLAHRLPRHPDLTLIPVRYFSATAGFNLLVYAGLRKVYTLGVDGGTAYGSSFDSKDQLANGRDSFDIQFTAMNATCRAFGARYISLANPSG